MARLFLVFAIVFFACKDSADTAKLTSTAPQGDVTLRVAQNDGKIEVFAFAEKNMGGFQFDVDFSGCKSAGKITTSTSLNDFQVNGNLLKNQQVYRLLGFSMSGKKIEFAGKEVHICNIEIEGFDCVAGVTFDNVVLADPTGKSLSLKKIEFGS